MSSTHEHIVDREFSPVIALAGDLETTPEINLSAGEPTLVLPKTRITTRYEVLKRTIDIVIASFILLLTSPIILLSCLIVRLTSRGPSIYTQVRLGKYRKPFVIYKLRSMYHDCERFSGIRWCSKNDNRITPFGTFLRKSHIDELPQLWNVLRGEMSLIGPRPERPELISKLQNQIPNYLERLLVKPGLTGLAQIQLPPDADIESVRKKLLVDCVYIEHLSFWLDCRIFIATFLYLLGVPQWKIRNMLKLPFPQELLIASNNTHAPIRETVDSL
ncbi:MAG: sugar transferase [Gemmatales bacterium]